MVSSPPTEAGYVEDEGRIFIGFTEVGNDRLDKLGESGVLVAPREAERLIGKLEGAVEQAEEADDD